jgi:hypothetical protein
MAVYIIPLTPEPQRFGIALAGKEYRLTVRWFEALEGGWVLDIDEPEGRAPIVAGIPLIAGADLLEQYKYLGFGGELWIDGALPPTVDNLGQGGAELVFITEDV